MSMHASHIHMRRGGGTDQLLEVLAKPSAREKATLQYFKSEGQPAIKEHCPHLTREECFKRCACVYVYVFVCVCVYVYVCVYVR